MSLTKDFQTLKLYIDKFEARLDKKKPDFSVELNVNNDKIVDILGVELTNEVVELKLKLIKDMTLIYKRAQTRILEELK